MDLKITGKFIQQCRKEKGLTQAQLAEKISVSEKTVSKWECGGGFPDTSLMLPLCETLDITANELLSGKKLSEGEYKAAAEDQLVSLKADKEKTRRMMWTLAVIALVMSVAFSIAVAWYVEAYLEMWLQILLVCASILPILVVALVVLSVERKMGTYECGRCGHKYVPTYKSMAFSMHAGFTRYLKCPKCGKRSWSKKHWEDE